jgi:hypothetical protein
MDELELTQILSLEDIRTLPVMEDESGAAAASSRRPASQDDATRQGVDSVPKLSVEEQNEQQQQWRWGPAGEPVAAAAASGAGPALTELPQQGESFEDDADIVMRVARMIKSDSELTQTKVAQEARINLGIVSKWLKGTYNGRNDKVAKGMKDWIEARRTGTLDSLVAPMGQRRKKVGADGAAAAAGAADADGFIDYSDEEGGKGTSNPLICVCL